MFISISKNVKLCIYVLSELYILNSLVEAGNLICSNTYFTNHLPHLFVWNPKIFVTEEPMQNFVTLAAFFLVEK